jgi:hypothetical protein
VVFGVFWLAMLREKLTDIELLVYSCSDTPDAALFNESDMHVLFRCRYCGATSNRQLITLA